MPKLIAIASRGKNRYFAIAFVLALGLVWWNARPARGAPYVNPFWANGSPSQESAIATVANRAMSPEGVDLRTGELFWNHYLFRTPGVVGDMVFSFTWRSMITGSSQLGNGIVPNWEVTAQYVLLLLLLLLWPSTYICPKVGWKVVLIKLSPGRRLQAGEGKRDVRETRS